MNDANDHDSGDISSGPTATSSTSSRVRALAALPREERAAVLAKQAAAAAEYYVSEMDDSDDELVDLDREAATVRAEGAKLASEGWLSDTASPLRVAAYIVASERVESLSLGEVVEIVRQGLDFDVAGGNTAAVRDLARDVLLKRAQA